MGKKGTVSLKIDDTGLKAFLLFTRDDSGKAVDKDRILDLLKKSGIREELYKDKLEEYMKLVEEDSIPDSFLIAEGTPPSPPVENSYEWKDLPIPEELIPDSERIFKTALDPEITVDKVEKVKVNKKVVQKSRFPFGKEKEKIVTVVEKRIKKIPVEVDPEVVETGWANAGDVLGEKKKPSEGSPGESVTGEEIPPGDPVREVFYRGKGVKDEKGKFVAEYSGFVRRGKNWIEIIPFKNHFWEVVLSKDKSTPLLNLTCGDELASPPFARSIIKKAVELGFEEDDLIGEDKISKIIHETISSGAFLKDFPLSVDRDASFSIYTSSDNLKGFLTIRKGSGNGKPLKLSEVGEAIKKSGFTGLNYKKIKEDLVNFYHSEEKVLKDYVLAEGKAPGKGEPQVLKFECTFADEEECRGILEKLKAERKNMGKETDDDFPLSNVQKCARVDKDSIIATVASTKKGPGGKDVYGNAIPGLDGDPPNVNVFEHLRMDNSIIVSEIDGILLYLEDEEDMVSLKVVYDKQTALRIDTDEDMMSARLSVYGAEEAGITPDEIKNALKERGIVKGLKEDVLEQVFKDIRDGKDVEDVLVAEGEAPVNEGSSRFRLLVDIKDSRNVAISENGRADYRNQDRITAVTEGTRLGMIISPDIKARDGWDITGKVIKAEKAPPLDIEIGENITVEEDEKGNRILLAETGGELVYDGKKIAVNHVHIVKGDIGLKEGNIKFPGSVKIGGDVTPGFFVMADGEVQIAGNVNAALVSSGQSIIIGQGVIGGGKAVLRSKKDIDMAFAEQAVILAVGNIRIKNSSLRCRIKCNGRLSLISDKGDLIGGQTQSTGGVDAHNIGNKNGAKTEISFGQNYLIQDRIEKEEKDLEKIKSQISRLDLMMRQFEKEGKKAHLAKARRQKLMLMKSLEKKGVRLFTLREKFEEHFESEIIVRGTVFPGVVFESHGRYHDIKAEKKSIRIFFNQETGRIEEEPLKKEA